MACSDSESIWTFGRTPFKADQPNARPLPTQDSTTQKKADKYQCLELDSNQRSQHSRGKRQYVPERARPLGSVLLLLLLLLTFIYNCKKQQILI